MQQTIFTSKYFENRIRQFDINSIKTIDYKKQIIDRWITALESGNLSFSKETQIDLTFLNEIFGELLDYDYQVDKQKINLIPKSSIESKEPDATLGFFTPQERSSIHAVIELKSSKIDLDRIQNRLEKISPVTQAFEYARMAGKSCKWVIVSNIQTIRLYHKESDRYELFNLIDLKNEFYLKRFFFLLHKDRLLFQNGESFVDALYRERLEEEIKITREFYSKYHSLRTQLFEHLIENNKAIKPTILLEKTQKLLDRIIFVCFCSDLEIISKTIVSEVVKTSNPSYKFTNDLVWFNLKQLFSTLDFGNNLIAKLNGGLFQNDELLNQLIIEDHILTDVLTLSEYDYRSDLNVNILGHIFEQSISDLEKIKKQINQPDFHNLEDTVIPKDGKRKEFGIFYTPESITQFLVKETIGSWLSDQRRQLGENDLLILTEKDYELIKITKNATLKTNENIEKNKHFWEQYSERLLSIKVLDPACGSGAFLVECFDYLINEYRNIQKELRLLHPPVPTDDYKLKLKQELSLNLQKPEFDIAAHILKNNLFGVDINFESVEITKLALWIKTVKRGKALTDIDYNIQQGNSLIADENIAGNLAFDWNKRFQKIMESGGFDVVIGNPPYVDSKKLKEFSQYFSQNYLCYAGTADLYVYFFELALQLLKPEGILGFINSNKFMKTGYGENLRKLLSTKQIQQIIDFTDYRIFDDALVASCIMLVKNSEPKENIKVSFVNENLDKYDTIAQYVSDNHFFTKSADLDHQIWFLSANGKIPVKRKIEENSVKLKDIEGVAIYRGVTTGFNDAFIIDETTKNQLIAPDSKNAEIIKPLLQGRNIRKWFYKKSSLFLIFTRKGIDIEQFKGIEEYLLQFKQKLEPGIGRKEGQYKWFEIQDNTAYFPEFEKEKIIWGLTADKWAYCYDDKGHFLPSNGYILTSNSTLSLKYILGILNSNLMRFYFDFIGIMTAGGAFTLKYDTVAEFPVKLHSNEYQLLVANLVDEMLESHKTMEIQKNRFLNRLNTNFENIKLNQKLQEFYNLDFKSIVNELNKQNIYLPFKQQDDFEEYFNENKNIIISLIENQKQLDNQINRLVYQIYNLTDSEIEIIEKS